LSVLGYVYLYSPAFQTIRPRTKYRRYVSSGVVLFVWCSVLFDVLSWCSRVVLLYYILLYTIYYTIIYCIILYYYYYILYIILLYILYYIIIYYILYYTLPFLSQSIFLFSSSYPSSHPINTCRYLHILIYVPDSSLPSLPLFLPYPHSILVGTYIYLFIFSQDIYLLSLPSSLLLFPPISFLPNPLIQSILVGTYIYLFILSHTRII
jgi:hypothetical protein